jgi:hypothetical protein
VRGYCATERDQLKQARKSDDDIDQSRERCVLATKDRRHQVELKKPDQTPVHRSDYYEKERDDVKHSHDALQWQGGVNGHPPHWFKNYGISTVTMTQFRSKWTDARSGSHSFNDDKVEDVFYPFFPPDRSARDVIEWLSQSA